MWEGKLVVIVAGWFSEEEFGYAVASAKLTTI